MSQTSPARPAGRRPALVTFAAILLFLLGGFELVLAITEFFQYAFGTLPPLVNYSIFWGILDVLYGLVLLYAWVEFPFANPAVMLTFCATFYCALRYAVLDVRAQAEKSH